MDQVTLSSPGGVLRLQRQVVRGLSDHRESVILDFPNPENELLQQAIQAARQAESQFLTIEIRPEQGDHQSLLLEHGFLLESKAIATVTSDYEPPADSPYKVRPPELADHFAAAVLNSTVLAHTLSAARDYDLSELTFRAMDDIFQRMARQDENSTAVILTHQNRMVGHLILELSPERGYIYDLAIEPAHWGGKAAQYIMRSASCLLFRKGIPLMTGDVSANNLRALKYAFRFLGFKVERERYSLKL
ncbi:GNAT family N-acetyltransferase [bacterium]|nr:GNAT family N-acetyltransferase [bacterium]